MAGIYLHIPFCEHKCIYCDFYSVENPGGVDVFLDALDREIIMHSHYGTQEEFETIYFGGGTPSLLTPPQLGRVLSRLYSTFSITPNAEITVETNPGTVDAGKLSDFRSIGVNRLSIGIQSFHEDDLRFLTRIHSAEQAKECVRTAHRVGFASVSIDLIFALPNQTMERWQSNTHQALELEPEHISAYSLIVEKGTPLARMVAAKQVAPLPVEEDAALYEWTMDALTTAGYEHYEVSNYAKHGFRSRHNSNYWNHTNYLGFGPSAHSFWNDRCEAVRWWNVANLASYLEKLAVGKSPIIGKEVLVKKQLLEEAVMLGLRSDGIDLERVKRDFNLDLVECSNAFVQKLLQQDFAVQAGTKIRLTDRGYLVCDAIAEAMLANLSKRQEFIPVPVAEVA